MNFLRILIIISLFTFSQKFFSMQIKTCLETNSKYEYLDIDKKSISIGEIKKLISEKFNKKDFDLQYQLVAHAMVALKHHSPVVCTSGNFAMLAQYAPESVTVTKPINWDLIKKNLKSEPDANLDDEATITDEFSIDIVLFLVKKEWPCSIQ